MVNFQQAVFSLLIAPFLPHPSAPDVHVPSKSIAIVGAGSAGLAALKTFLDLPEKTRANWDIILYEQRKDVGGIWLPDPDPAPPPKLPETPLYPRLRTNTPVPSMTYPGFLFPPNTPLYPSHDHIWRYHQDYATHFSLYPHIRLKHAVMSSNWVGNSTWGQWNVTVRDAQEQLFTRTFDHLVVASGHNQYPYIPTWRGQDAWLANSPVNGPTREIVHSIWYREPQLYANKTVIIVGSGASGQDMASQIVGYANQIYHSSKNLSEVGPDVISKPEISHFTPSAVVFIDGTSISGVDALLLGTGYELRIPFLERGHALQVDPAAHSNVTYTQGLVTNTRYLFPVHRHVFSLCPNHPINALSFIGLPLYVSNCPSDIAQSLYVAHIIADSNLLPSRDELLKELAVEEQRLRSLGLNPYHIGHRILPRNGTEWDYQDGLVEDLKQWGAIPNDGIPYVEKWRREERPYLRRAWKRVEALRTEAEWLEGVESESEWADLMRRLNQWQADWEEEQGLHYPIELPIGI